MWPLHVPEFSVVDTHTRRPYKSKPKMEQIQFFSQSRGYGSYNLTLIFNSSRILGNYKTLLTEHALLNDETSTSGSLMNSKAILSIYRIIFTIHHMIN